MTTDITVKPGQIWADNDPRGYGREVRVIEIVRRHTGGNGAHYPAGVEHAVVEQVDPRGGSGKPGRRSTIRLDRFRPTANGYRLIRDVED